MVEAALICESRAEIVLRRRWPRTADDQRRNRAARRPGEVVTTRITLQNIDRWHMNCQDAGSDAPVST
jgi:hypothetical protein